MITDYELKVKLAKEDIYYGYCVLQPIWEEILSYPDDNNIRNALTTSDTLIRSDGSGVALDACLSDKGKNILRLHTNGEISVLKRIFPEIGSLDDMVGVELNKQAVQIAIQKIGWGEYVYRLQSFYQ